MASKSCSTLIFSHFINIVVALVVSGRLSTAAVSGSNLGADIKFPKGSYFKGNGHLGVAIGTYASNLA